MQSWRLYADSQRLSRQRCSVVLPIKLATVPFSSFSRVIGAVSGLVSGA